MKNLRFRLSKRTGFTLAETMASLLIFSLIILIMGCVFNDVRRNDYRSYTTQFYSYLSVIEDQHYVLRKCMSNELTFTKGRKTYYVRFSPDKHQLIMSTKKGGYVLLMNRVKSVNWRRDHKFIRQQVTMMGGEQFSGTSKFSE